MDKIEINHLQQCQEPSQTINKFQQLHDQLQVDVDKFYQQEAHLRGHDAEEGENNIFDCEIEFPEEWTQVEKVEIKSGLKIEWIATEQRNMCKQYLLCIHCKNVLWNPKKCKKCKRHSCQVCFESIQRCSFCPELPDSKLVMKDAEEFCTRQLNDLSVYCPFQKRGCRCIVEYGKFEEHVNGCNFRVDDQNVRYKQISIVSYRFKQLQALQKSHILYTIETHIKGSKKVSKVERRYKQFEILHQYFSNREQYFGMPLPSLPPKTFCLSALLGSNSNQISEEENARFRMTELETYLLIMGHYYKDDRILEEFLTNEEGFNYLNSNKNGILNMEFILQKYQSIKYLSTNYFQKLLNNGLNKQNHEVGDQQQTVIKKSEALQQLCLSLQQYKQCFGELKKALIFQISSANTQIQEIERNIEKIDQYHNESLMNEFLKKFTEEVKQFRESQNQMSLTLKKLQTLHKYIESIDNCVNTFDNMVIQYEIIHKSMKEVSVNEQEKQEYKEAIQQMTKIEKDCQKYHELAEAQSNSILQRLDKELPAVIQMIQVCFYHNEV